MHCGDKYLCTAKINGLFEQPNCGLGCVNIDVNRQIRVSLHFLRVTVQQNRFSFQISFGDVMQATEYDGPAVMD